MAKYSFKLGLLYKFKYKCMYTRSDMSDISTDKNVTQPRGIIDTSTTTEMINHRCSCSIIWDSRIGV